MGGWVSFFSFPQLVMTNLLGQIVEFSNSPAFQRKAFHERNTHCCFCMKMNYKFGHPSGRYNLSELRTNLNHPAQYSRSFSH